MKQNTITLHDFATRKPYTAPVVEVYEYLTESGFQSSMVYDAEVFIEYVDEEGENTVGGEWLD